MMTGFFRLLMPCMRRREVKVGWGRNRTGDPARNAIFGLLRVNDALGQGGLSMLVPCYGRYA
jgi:hypothetical protein